MTEGRWAARIGGAAVMLVAIALWLPALLPGILDDVYYRGPVSTHFDGRRFFNIDGEQGTGGSQRFSFGRFARFAAGTERQPWPESVPVTPTRVPARVDGPAMRVTWVGHATALIQTQGLNILTDPIWSDYASPLPPLGPRRVRAPGIAFDDLPRIDLILISHNHYDHMDLQTLKRLWRRDRPLIVTSLGNDAVMAKAGVPSRALDWDGRLSVRPGIDVIVERVHHWDSRWGADRNRALWSGFTVTLPGGNLFFAGDTGFGDGGWPLQAARRGPIRLAIIPIGAFRPREMMSGNHIGPVEAVEVFRRLGAAQALAIHWGTFQLSNERIDEPRELLATTLARHNIARDRFRAVEAGGGWTVPPL